MSFESPQTQEEEPLTKEKMLEDEKSLWEKVGGNALATTALTAFLALTSIGCKIDGAAMERGVEMYENNRTARKVEVRTTSVGIEAENSKVRGVRRDQVREYRGPDETYLYRDNNNRSRSNRGRR
jgi:hypothetical protein